MLSRPLQLPEAASLRTHTRLAFLLLDLFFTYFTLSSRSHHGRHKINFQLPRGRSAVSVSICLHSEGTRNPGCLARARLMGRRDILPSCQLVTRKSIRIRSALLRLGSRDWSSLHPSQRQHAPNYDKSLLCLGEAAEEY